MRADMTDELPDEHLLSLTSAGAGFMTDDERITRMENDLMRLRQVLMVLVADRPDLLQLLRPSPTGATEGRL
jgi:hypothetical protein